MIKDRLFRGFAAGLIGGLVMNVYSLIAQIMNWTALPFWKWAVIMTLGREQNLGTPEIILGVIAHLVFTGFLGIAFSYLVPHIKHEGIILKGVLFSILTWFIIYAITHLFQVQGTTPLLLKTAVSNVTGATIYGITLGWALAWLYNKSLVK